MINPFKQKLSKKLNFPKRLWNGKELSESERKKYQDSFNQIKGQQFIEILDGKFTPFMKENGFRGSKNNFYKKDSPWIFTMQIFKDKWGGSCAINNGVHLDFMETRLNSRPIPSKFRTSDCIINNTDKIHFDNGNNWLFYGKNEKEAEETVDFMIDMVEKKVFPYFNKFNNFPEPFSLITLNDLLIPNDNFKEFGINKSQLEWVHFKIFLSRVNHHIGNNDFALEVLNSVKTDEFYISRSKDNEVVQLIDELVKTYS